MYRENAARLGTVDNGRRAARQLQTRDEAPKMSTEQADRARALFARGIEKRKVDTESLDRILSLAPFMTKNPKSKSTGPGKDSDAGHLQHATLSRAKMGRRRKGGARRTRGVFTTTSIVPFTAPSTMRRPQDQKTKDQKSKDQKSTQSAVKTATSVILNNNSAVARLSGAKRLEAFRGLAELASRAKGTFSMTNSGLDSDFAEILARRALAPNVNPDLKEINLESNAISDRGFRALGKALATNSSLTSIKLRHQISSPSVEVQKLLVGALEANQNLIRLSVDLHAEWARRRDKLEARNRDLLRQRRRHRAVQNVEGP